MKRLIVALALPTALLTALVIGLSQRRVIAQTPGGWFIERDAEVKQPGPGPHGGKGTSVGYLFFEKIPNLGYSFRKRVLHKAASIGYHKQEVDEVYYFLEGHGTMTLDGKAVPVKPGDCVLTRKGSAHGCENTGEGDLTIIVVFPR